MTSIFFGVGKGKIRRNKGVGQLGIEYPGGTCAEVMQHQFQIFPTGMHNHLPARIFQHCHQRLPLIDQQWVYQVDRFSADNLIEPRQWKEGIGPLELCVQPDQLPPAGNRAGELCVRGDPLRRNRGAPAWRERWCRRR